jgi:hypothetical protein
MRRYWLMDQHGADGPTALVETDGSLHVIDVLKFGPAITELEGQQQIWDDVIGHVAPTLKPFVNAKDLQEDGVEPHDDLVRRGTGNKARGGHPDATGRGLNAGRSGGNPNFKGRRGDR